MKYIRSKFNEFVVFPNTIQHKDMLAGLKRIDGLGLWDEPVSAGFVELRNSKFNVALSLMCYGLSTSLGVESLKEDTELLKKKLL